MNILIVDDSRTYREILSNLFKSLNYTVWQAKDGVEALELLEKEVPDLITLDLQMPRMDGLTVLKKIRECYDATTLPILMTTSENQPETIYEALEAGANDYITKPLYLPVMKVRAQNQLKFLQTHRALQSSEERFALALQGANDGLWDWDIVQKKIYYSPRWESILGLLPGAMQGSQDAWLSRIHPEDKPNFLETLNQHLAARSDQFYFKYRLRHANGLYRWVLTRGAILRNAEGQAVRMVGSQSDVTDTTLTDPTTGLYNTILLSDRLSQALQRLNKNPLKNAALILLNVVDFKKINQSYGLDAGNALLSSIAKRLQNLMEVLEKKYSNVNFTLAHHTGDEFLLLLDETAAEENIEAVAKKMVALFEEPFQYEEEVVFLKARTGIVVCKSLNAYQSPNHVIRDAAQAARRARDNNTDLEWWNAALQTQVSDSLKLDAEVRRAVQQSEFLLYHQPVVNFNTNEVIGVECLLRWQHPDKGILAPAHFIDALEQGGLLNHLTPWILQTACETWLRWKSQLGGDLPPPIQVNFGAGQFHESNTVEGIFEILKKTKMQPENLIIEITEGVLIKDFDQARRNIEALAAAGIKMAMDDFGTGYSSFSYLANLPFDTIKLDREFLRYIMTNVKSKKVIAGMLKLANDLNMKIVVEGIEHDAECQVLKNLGCTFGQGYLFAKPMPEAALPEFLRTFCQQAVKSDLKS